MRNLDYWTVRADFVDAMRLWFRRTYCRPRTAVPVLPPW